MRLLTVVLALALPVTLTAQDWAGELSEFTRRQMKRDGVTVAALAVVSGDSLLFAEVFGSDASVSDPFVIGSMSKSMTATVVLQFVARGLIGLNRSVETYLPGFAHDATVRELLNHRSGFTRADGFQAVPETGAVTRGPSGSRGIYSYSNVNYALLGRILERVAGQPYQEVMAASLFDPLGMRRSSAGPEPLEDLVPGRRTWFWWDGPAPYLRPENGLIPAGFIQSSPLDMATYLQAHLREDSTSGLGLEPEDFRLLHRPPDGGDYGYAMGWVASRWTETRSIQHSGQTDAYSSMMVALPEVDLAVVLLTASNGFTARNHLMDGALRIVRGQERISYGRWERWLRLLALIALIGGATSFVKHTARWIGQGRPRRLRSGAPLARLSLGVGFNLALLFGVPFLFELPLTDLPVLAPDLGLALIGGVALGSVEAVLRYLTQPPT